jgi:hypothetical protein
MEDYDDQETTRIPKTPTTMTMMMTMTIPWTDLVDGGLHGNLVLRIELEVIGVQALLAAVRRPHVDAPVPGVLCTPSGRVRTGGPRS